jgi:preprotein translocase subunit YajC
MAALIVVVILFALFWLVLVRPQRRRTQEQTYLIDTLEVGDEIVSAGGFYAVIKEIEGETLHVEIADGLVVRMARNAVVGLVEHDDEHDEEREEDGATVPIEDDST